jgi:uncharacterized membrane protein YdjX (TVP38/TMEM64 family)
MSKPVPAAAGGGAAGLRRLLPLIVIVALIALAFALDLDRYLSFEALRQNRERLLDFVAARPVAAPLLFVIVYASAVALSLPGAVFLTLAGGFLFGTVQATLLVVVGATLGACAIFLIARGALGDLLRARAGPWLAKMEAGFRENALSYLLVLRLIPIFPFWLVNLVPAFLGVPLRTFALATLVGIIPGSLVYSSVGAGLGAVFDQGGTPDLGIILEPEILLPIIGLALLALLPVAYKRWRGGRA